MSSPPFKKASNTESTLKIQEYSPNPLDKSCKIHFNPFYLHFLVNKSGTSSSRRTGSWQSTIHIFHLSLLNRSTTVFKRSRGRVQWNYQPYEEGWECDQWRHQWIQETSNNLKKHWGCEEKSHGTRRNKEFTRQIQEDQV
jgi:hypothetical protein